MVGTDVPASSAGAVVTDVHDEAVGIDVTSNSAGTVGTDVPPSSAGAVGADVPAGAVGTDDAKAIDDAKAFLKLDASFRSLGDTLDEDIATFEESDDEVLKREVQEIKSQWLFRGQGKAPYPPTL